MPVRRSGGDVGIDFVLTHVNFASASIERRQDSAARMTCAGDCLEKRHSGDRFIEHLGERFDGRKTDSQPREGTRSGYRREGSQIGLAVSMFGKQSLDLWNELRGECSTRKRYGLHDADIAGTLCYPRQSHGTVFAGGVSH